MRLRAFSILLIICQILISNISGYVVADESDCDDSDPSNRVARSIRFDQLFSLAEDGRREVIDRLKSYFRWPSSVIKAADVILAEGIGEVFVVGDDICTDGITEVDGAVPISGGVSFGGPVRASGTVTIAGRCAPASGISPLRIGQPLLPRPIAMPPPPLPLMSTSILDVLPLPEPIPKPVCEILPIIEPAPLPAVTLPQVVLPALVIPAYILPEVVLPPSEVYDLATGYGDIFVAGNDIIVSGSTFVDAVVPTVGEVTFSGFVPAKGTVTVFSCF